MAYFNVPSSLMKAIQIYEGTKLSMCAPTFQLLKQWTDFHKIWYGCCAITGHPNFTTFNFLHSAIKNGGRINWRSGSEISANQFSPEMTRGKRPRKTVTFVNVIFF